MTGNEALAARQRMTCRCGYMVRMAIWCHDPACCDPDLTTFLAGLLAEERETGLPTFGARFLEDPGEYAPTLPVRVWRAGSIEPVYTGPVGQLPAAVMQHTCPAEDEG